MMAQYDIYRVVNHANRATKLQFLKKSSVSLGFLQWIRPLPWKGLLSVVLSYLNYLLWWQSEIIFHTCILQTSHMCVNRKHSSPIHTHTHKRGLATVICITTGLLCMQKRKFLYHYIEQRLGGLKI